MIPQFNSGLFIADRLGRTDYPEIPRVLADHYVKFVHTTHSGVQAQEDAIIYHGVRSL